MLMRFLLVILLLIPFAAQAQSTIRRVNGPSGLGNSMCPQVMCNNGQNQYSFSGACQCRGFALLEDDRNCPDSPCLEGENPLDIDGNCVCKPRYTRQDLRRPSYAQRPVQRCPNQICQNGVNKYDGDDNCQCAGFAPLPRGIACGNRDCAEGENPLNALGQCLCLPLPTVRTRHERRSRD